MVRVVPQNYIVRALNILNYLCMQEVSNKLGGVVRTFNAEWYTWIT